MVANRSITVERYESVSDVPAREQFLVVLAKNIFDPPVGTFVNRKSLRELVDLGVDVHIRTPKG